MLEIYSGLSATSPDSETGRKRGLRWGGLGCPGDIGWAVVSCVGILVKRMHLDVFGCIAGGTGGGWRVGESCLNGWLGGWLDDLG